MTLGLERRFTISFAVISSLQSVNLVLIPVEAGCSGAGVGAASAAGVGAGAAEAALRSVVR